MAGEKITREKIIRAVLDSAFEKSSGGTSLADISAILGIKKASLYNHFASRDDMINATTAACDVILKKVHLLPGKIELAAKKYSAQALTKALAKRYLAFFEKAPVFQVYVYVESQKFFDPEVSKIESEAKARLTGECLILLEVLAKQGKISTEKANAASAIWLANGMRELLSYYLLERKNILRNNPLGENSLFEAPDSDKTVKKIESLIAHFMNLVQ